MFRRSIEVICLGICVMGRAQPQRERVRLGFNFPKARQNRLNDQTVHDSKNCLSWRLSSPEMRDRNLHNRFALRSGG